MIDSANFQLRFSLPIGIHLLCWFVGHTTKKNKYDCKSLYPSICPSIYMSIHLYVHPSICMSIHLYVCPSIYMYVHPSSVHPFICPSIYVSIHLYVHPSIRPSIYLSISSWENMMALNIFTLKWNSWGGIFWHTNFHTQMFRLVLKQILKVDIL